MASLAPNMLSALALRLPARAIGLLVAAAGVASAALLYKAVGDWRPALAFVAAYVALGGLLLIVARMRGEREAQAPAPDRALLRAVADAAGGLVAITDRAGRLVAASDGFVARFGAVPPPGLQGLDAPSVQALTEAGHAAWRDGESALRGLPAGDGALDVAIARAGIGDDHLVWRVADNARHDLVAEARRLVEGGAGERLGLAGVMAVLVSSEGRILAANRVFAMRATGRPDGALAGQDLTALLRADPDDAIRLRREGDEALPLRPVQVALDEAGAGGEGPSLFLLLDESDHGGERAQASAAADIYGLLAMLPLGLALVDRDGRFLFQNRAFLRAAHVPDGETPLYPGDLVVKEDKGAVADAVRRFAQTPSGQGLSGDLAVRLKNRPDEPVALTIAGARGLGQAATLLSLKDNAEESRLKKQVAQQTKMQAVGQLAGGVAHDFNNILTAIIGHCDLMLMRHTPGDSDYDDIQQVKLNSNRAAALTRQLLAFSRQQTLRPQILQLPDVVSEVSNLLKRLIGDSLTLVIKHGRNLGPVRADPGQLEQVIINLAVNARDAMPEGGTLTIQTYAVSAAEVRRLGSDILPVTDYTALSVTDTGVGIPAADLPKIFEPFYTTKEVGKGTGLGLSTVYGIVKQSEGFIFADSTVGQGTSFVIYLPVHRAAAAGEGAAPPPKARPPELWGSGHILLVEDEDMVRTVAERALVRQGYKVTTAGNGEEAMEVLGALGPDERFDLLVSDVMMPTMDGPTLVRHARVDFPELPILFMSGYAEEQIRKSIDLDNIAFLPKPFSVQQLAETVRDVLARSGARSGN